jgi:alpha-D-ribose 1-methylphosphonate 5-triphosphate synthase subunit PhnH
MITRRDFFVSTAVGAAGVALADAQAPPAAAVAAEASARYDWIIGKWGARLTDEQKAGIRRMLIDNEKGLATMRAFPLGNEVEPSK